MSKIIYWHGITADGQPHRWASSMHVVDYYNILALQEMGWEVRQGWSPDFPCIGFFHQGYGVHGKPSFHYCCTSSTCTLPEAAEETERAHRIVFVLNSLMHRNFTKRGINAMLWPHGVDPRLKWFDSVEKFDTFTIINVAQGQFGPDKSIKGIPWLVDAVMGVPDVHMIQIGASWTPDTVLPLADGPTQLSDLEPKIQFRGMISHDEALKLMAQSHLMVSTSVGEGCPLPAVEALGLGLPQLTTDLPYTHDWPFHDIVRRIPSEPFLDVGFLHDQPFSPRDLDAYVYKPYLYRPKNIREHILKAIEDPGWLAECSEYRSYARRYASWERMLQNYALPAIEALL